MYSEARSFIEACLRWIHTSFHDDIHYGSDNNDWAETDRCVSEWAHSVGWVHLIMLYSDSKDTVFRREVLEKTYCYINSHRITNLSLFGAIPNGVYMLLTNFSALASYLFDWTNVRKWWISARVNIDHMVRFCLYSMLTTTRSTLRLFEFKLLYRMPQLERMCWSSV